MRTIGATEKAKSTKGKGGKNAEVKPADATAAEKPAEEQVKAAEPKGDKAGE